MAEAWVRPRTIVGQWLMVMMQWRLEDRDRLQQQLNVAARDPGSMMSPEWSKSRRRLQCGDCSLEMPAMRRLRRLRIPEFSGIRQQMGKPRAK
jgi:hypothetical protein